MRTPIEALRLLVGVNRTYSIRLACSAEEVRAAQALRFDVFNLELNEGLEESYCTGLDADRFDAVCDHLLVEHTSTKEVVGTYRLQTGTNAGDKLGYYSAQEFDFAPFEPMRAEIVELGRACVHQAHRNMVVLGLLWKGIADYAQARKARYLCGCSSLTSQDPAVGASAYAELCRKHLAPAEWRTTPLPAFECSLDILAPETPKIPKLLRAYLNVGGKICGPPALDRTFKTIDYLTWLDLGSLPSRVATRYLD
jgi:putative hemolysin